MKALIWRLPLFILLILFLGLVFVPQAQAASLGRAYDRLSTSRPSASAPLAANQAANADQVVITDLSDNVMFLASDSAVLMSDTGQTLNSVTVASASAADTPASNQRTVFFAGNIANAHHQGTTVYKAVPAMHEISFLATTTIPDTGDILLTFPALTSGDANNPASPSATTFQFNGLPSDGTKIQVTDDGIEITPTIAVTNPSAGVGGTIRITLSGAEISADSVVRIFLGCTDSSPDTTCSEQNPLIINPTQSSTTLGTARTWLLTIETMNGSDVGIDSARIRIGTIDSVLVQGTVDATLSITIAGLITTDNYNTKYSDTTACGSETPNSGINSTATTVNLGDLGTPINHAGQSITVSTNAPFGYTITATSSGRFIDPTTGSYLLDANTGNGLTGNDAPAPAAITAGTPAFGVSPCGARVSISGTPDWGGGSNTVSSGALFSNPWTSNQTLGYYATIASYTAPVDSDHTIIRYAATVSGLTPAGLYRTIFTYVVTATF